MKRSRAMRKPLRLVALATVLVAVAALPTATLAQNAHLKGRNPVLFNDNGLTLTATVSYAGLGNFDTLQNVSASAQPTANCVNPRGRISHPVKTLRRPP